MQNPWIKAQLRIRNTIKEEYKLDYKLQIIHRCDYDPDFKQNGLLIQMMDLKRNNNILFLYEFESLKKEYYPEKHDFYRYLQLRNHSENNIRSKPDDTTVKLLIKAIQIKVSYPNFIKVLGWKKSLYGIYYRKSGKRR